MLALSVLLQAVYQTSLDTNEPKSMPKFVPFCDQIVSGFQIGDECVMSAAIVSSSYPVTLVGGGDVSPADIDMALKLAPKLVAADGGAEAALATGTIPEAVIGDFDSLSVGAREQFPADRLHHIAEQNSTDFDKALRNIDAPLVIGVGFLGARIDHQLAAMTTLAAHPDRICLLIGTREIVVHLPPHLSCPMTNGDTVSIYPLVPVSGRSTGLAWPIDGLTLKPRGRIGTSNMATGPVAIEMAAPGALGIFPRARLVPLMQACLATDAGRWRVRA